MMGVDMDYQRLQPYPLLTKLSAAIYAGDIELAERILSEAITINHEPGVAASIIKGKRIVRPDRLPPLKEGTNLDYCVKHFGLHNGYGYTKRDGGTSATGS